MLNVLGPAGLAEIERDRNPHIGNLNKLELIRSQCEADQFDMAFLNARNTVQMLQQKLSPQPPKRDCAKEQREEFDLGPCH
ncbi:MAG: hypothetical protein AB7L18_14760 [Hyphomicrobiaceae bacterium]